MREKTVLDETTGVFRTETASAVLDSIADPITVVDSKGSIQYANIALRRLLSSIGGTGGGGDRWCVGGDYVAATAAVFPAAEKDVSALSDGLRTVLSGQQARFDLDYPYRTGEEASWLALSVTPCALEGVTGALVQQRDVTGRYRAEQALWTEQHRFDLAFANAPIGMAMVSLKGRFLRVNESLANMVGRTTDEMMTLDFQGITHPEDRGPDVENLHRMIRGEIKIYKRVKRYFHSSGDIVWI
jgi:PAS domain S-box-containing protein